MDEVRRLSDQLKRSYEGHAWHGPALCDLLEGLSAEAAARRPIPDAHSIWELVLHVAAWEDAARRMLDGESVGAMPEAENFPPVTELSEKAWHEALGHLESVHRALLEDVHDLTDEELMQEVPSKKYTVYFLLHGVVQHNIYHAGQIALLKKLL